jgi:hypothetical protein
MKWCVNGNEENKARKVLPRIGGTNLQNQAETARVVKRRWRSQGQRLYVTTPQYAMDKATA